MDITQAILLLHPDAKFVCWENDYQKVEWQELNIYPLPSLTELETAWKNRTPPKPPPNWDLYMDLLLPSDTYKKILTSTKQRSVGRVELSIAVRPNTMQQLNRLRGFWNDSISGIIPTLLLQDAEFLKSTSTQASMTFTFNNSAQMILAP